jgi:hypothetical protein
MLDAALDRDLESVRSGGAAGSMPSRAPPRAAQGEFAGLCEAHLSHPADVIVVGLRTLTPP